MSTPETQDAPSLDAMQDAIHEQLSAILKDAQAKVRAAHAGLKAIPSAYRQNGLKGSLVGIIERLDKADELFVEAYKSVEATYGRPVGATKAEDGEAGTEEGGGA